MCPAPKFSKLAILKWVIYWKINNFWGFWGKSFLDIMKNSYFEKNLSKKKASLKIISF